MFASRKIMLVDHVLRSYAKLYTRSHTRLHDHRFCNHGVTIAFFFDMSFNKQVIVKNHLQLGKKSLKLMRE